MSRADFGLPFWCNVYVKASKILHCSSPPRRITRRPHLHTNISGRNSDRRFTTAPLEMGNIFHALRCFVINAIYPRYCIGDLRTVTQFDTRIVTPYIHVLIFKPLFAYFYVALFVYVNKHVFLRIKLFLGIIDRLDSRKNKFD